MKITKVAIYQLPLSYPLMSRARATQATAELDDTIVAVKTDAGVVGYGECCPLAPTYLPATGEGTRAGIKLLAPLLLGYDARGVGAINSRMDESLLGHPAAKSAIDMACWDIVGKSVHLPSHIGMGGAVVDRFPLYVTIPHDEPDAMADSLLQRRAQGYKVFQLKVGGHPEADIERLLKLLPLLQPGERAFADANRGWLLEDGLRVTRAMRDWDLMIEQPCDSYDACLELRRRSACPMMLDEAIDDMKDLLRGLADRAMDAVVLKLSHVGGVSKALAMARVCIELGVRVRIEDTVGRSLSNAAVSQLSGLIPPKYLFASYLCPPYPPTIGQGDPLVEHGTGYLSQEPGLGVTISPGELGSPIFEVAL